MLSTTPVRQNFLIVAALITCLLLYTSFRAPSTESNDLLYPDADGDLDQNARKKPHHDSFVMDKMLQHVQNETLGFQEIYMISLPTRTDKRDTFAMQAALSSIKYTQMDGVDGQMVPSKALPHTMEQNVNAIGCWRAHLNVLQKIVHEDIATALIFEDDADWDVSLKSQLVQFARGSRYISNTTHAEKAASPYGDNWDILWIGHCGTWYHEEDNRRMFVIPNDPTVEPPSYRQNVDEPDMEHWQGGPSGDNQTRIVFNSKGGICTAAYAISQQGARKALYHMSMTPYNSPVDWGYANMCMDKNVNYTCISVFPQIIGVSRPTGHTSKNSDIGYGDDDARTVEEARSQHIVYSTRLNMERLLRGETIFDSQFPEITGSEMHIEDIGAAVGHIEVLRDEDLPKPKPKEGEEEEEVEVEVEEESE